MDGLATSLISVSVGELTVLTSCCHRYTSDDAGSGTIGGRILGAVRAKTKRCARYSSEFVMRRARRQGQACGIPKIGPEQGDVCGNWLPRLAGPLMAFRADGSMPLAIRPAVPARR
jgi:hypothetical protein